MGHQVMLWGLSGDPPLESVRRALARHDVPHVVLDQRHMGDVHCELEVAADRVTGRIAFGRQVIDIDEIDAIFVRPYDVDRVVRDPSDADTLAAARDLTRLLLAWTDVAEARVINRPSAMISNSSKPYQAELIARAGFAIPGTLVTTSPDGARDFIARHEHVVYKSVSDTRSTVSRVDRFERDRIDDVVSCPTQFQVYIAGTDWRVHVVGDELYACEIRCAADDYRCAELEGLPVDVRPAIIPVPIATRCRKLAQSLALPLAGIDLRRTGDDEWYCFEVNPAPAFSYYEQATGQPLGAAVARLLSGTRRGARIRGDS